MKSLFPVICCQDVAASANFYAKLLGLRAVFESDWYMQLQSPTDVNLQVGFVRRDHPSVPERFQKPPAGVFVTIEVEDVDAIYARAEALGLAVVLPLRDEPWGQRHFMTLAPDGLPLDIVKVIPASAEFLAESETT
ncbi:MAG: VOC family protein [Gemmatimonadaceae bacterium]